MGNVVKFCRQRYFNFIIIVLCVLGYASSAWAQSFNIDLGSGSLTGRVVQLIALMTVLSLAPGFLVTITSFTRIIIVLGLLRQALGLQQTPPNMVIISLALFLTGFVMAPTFQQAWSSGILPLINEEIEEMEAFERAVAPFRVFMSEHVREKDLGLFYDLAEVELVASNDPIPLHILVPAFMISEFRRAFEIGFLLFIPFIVIDMVVSSILMSMGMMMLPPVMISLPFKLIFFILVDGWFLVSGTLVRSFTG